MLRALLIPLLATAACAAGDLHEERTWTGTNGTRLQAKYVRTLEDGERIELLTSAGAKVTAAIANLSAEDRELVASLGADPPEAGSGGGFKILIEPDRETLPIISQSDYGNKASDCVPSSFCNFLLWWDEQGVLPIPKRGDFDRKAEWVHSRVARYCVTRNTRGTDLDSASEGFLKYFERELAGVAAMDFHVDFDLRPENLARYTTGNYATMLAITIRDGPRHDSGHWVALASAEPDGRIAFHTWGQKFEAQLEVHEPSDEILNRSYRPRTSYMKLSYSGRMQRVPATSYRIKILNRDDLPDRFRNSDREFLLDPRQWDYLYIAKPYVYQIEGKVVPLPADPLLGPPAQP